MELVNGRDLDALVELFATDAVVLAPTGDQCDGREAIRAFYRDTVFANGAGVRPTRHHDAGTTCVMELDAVIEGLTGPAPQLVDVFTIDDDGRIARLAVYVRQPR